MTTNTPTTPHAGPSDASPGQDRVLASVAAYSDHLDSYRDMHANAAQDMVDAFCARLDPAHDVILDAGCGPGRDLVRFAEHGHCAIGVDLNDAFVTAARDTVDGWPVRVEHGDLRNLAFDDDRFAATWACASLVHLPVGDAHLALREIARVTRAGGPVHISVKHGHDSGWYDTVHGRRWFQHWTVAAIATAAEAAGLHVTSAAVDGAFVTVDATA